ncbi:MAG: hypothetical protein RI911_149 [Candidatus Parcubacteria bacterium]
MNPSEARSYIRDTIISQVYIQSHKEYFSNGAGEKQTTGWLFDFRRVIMQGAMIDAIGTVFTETFKQIPKYQVCGLEVAAIPLVTGITQFRYNHGETSANGFFIRKSRKKEGLLRMIEGTIYKDTPIILVDDIMNQGKTFMRQIQVLETLGYKIHAVWTILRYRDESFYTFLHERGIEIHSVITLDELAKDIQVKNLVALPQVPPMQQQYTPTWKFTSDDPNYFWVVPKSAPVLDAERVFFGADNGNFWAIRQSDGSIAWSYKVGLGAKGKRIFSTAAVYDGTVFFGAYDGNVYALDADTGKRKWVFFDADWVGSSPVVAPKLGLVFIGLEFGLWKKRGGIAAISIETGKKVWWDNSMRNYTHATPLYVEQKDEVVIGSNDGILRLYDARTGVIKWSSKTGDPSPKELQSGFSEYDIKSSPAYDPKLDIVIAANMHGTLCALARDSGKQQWSTQAEFGFFGSPIIHHDTVLAASLDKHLYCVSLKDGTIHWKCELGARLFSTPLIVNGQVVVGSNDGRVYSVNPVTGTVIGHTTLTERITNAVAYRKETDTLFVTTYANELYSLKRQ